jgi:hypothetical protein
LLFVFLEHTEAFLYVGSLVDSRVVLNYIESDGLGKRTALTNCNNITFLHVLESWRAMCSHVCVAFLETIWDMREKGERMISHKRLIFWQRISLDSIKKFIYIELIF